MLPLFKWRLISQQQCNIITIDYLDLTNYKQSVLCTKSRVHTTAEFCAEFCLLLPFL
jgi:hypothetical protein